jgi:two-component system nitrogen regulation response regulator GlnG
MRLCNNIIKANDTHDRILVPSRFGLIGITPAISALRERIDRFARSNSPVLIRGESGTGKELAAQALHDAGDRAGEPFVPVNCPAVPESVFESQLFGHVAGAFTGAAKDQAGLIELAGDGTLFLDEVGDLPAGVQAKLLRFLENGEYRRLGSDKVRRSRARVLAATHRNLAGQERFRQDLYHRLRRLEIVMPPLAERREDIRYLARHRVRQLNLQDGSGWKQLDEAAERRLEALDYPGNVRELFNLVDHAWHEAVQPIGEAEVERARQRLEAERAAAAPPLAVDFAAAQVWSLDFNGAGAPLKQIQEQAAVQAIRQALEHFKGDIDQTARFLDVSRRSVYRYLERERESDRA